MKEIISHAIALLLAAILMFPISGAMGEIGLCLLASTAEEYLDDSLDDKISSNDPELLLKVAECELAKEEHLLAVAKKSSQLNVHCTGFDSDNCCNAYKIAKALVGNPATTGKVLNELVQSEHPEVWLFLAESEVAKEGVLETVAEKCANYSIYESYPAYLLANALATNGGTTDDVMNRLLSSPHEEVVSIAQQWLEQ